MLGQGGKQNEPDLCDISFNHGGAECGAGAGAGGNLAQVLRTPRALQEQGCGYCVRAPAEPEAIRQLLTAERIAFRRLYRRGADGAWQEAEP